MDLRVLPNDQNLEGYVLGCLLYEPRCFEEVADIFSPELFYYPKHRAIAQVLARMCTEDPNSVTFETVAVEPEIIKAGVKPSELTQYGTSIASTRSIRHAVEKLRLLYAKREAIKIAQGMMAVHDLHDAEEIRRALAQAESQIAAINETTTRQDTLSSAREAALSFMETFETLYQNRDKGVTGIPSGFRDLDRITLGFQPKDLIIMAGRPGMGKTALMLSMALNMASAGKKVLIFSLEMSTDALMWRLVSNVTGIEMQKLRSGKVTPDEYVQVTNALAYISKLTLFIDEQSQPTTSDLRAKARKVKRESGLDVVFVDYLGFIRGEGESRVQEVSRNVWDLKAMAKDFGIPVICLAQLNRAVEQRQDKRPVLSDLRESGEIEQTADLVLFLYREDYYENNTDKQNVVEVHIAKHRNGPTGTVELYADLSRFRFGDATKRTE